MLINTKKNILVYFQIKNYFKKYSSLQYQTFKYHCCCCGCCFLTPIIMNPHHLPSMWKEGDSEYFNVDDAVQDNVEHGRTLSSTF